MLAPSSSAGKADRNWMEAPRCMNESVRSLKSSEVWAVEYCTATSSLTVVDMGASLEGPRR